MKVGLYARVSTKRQEKEGTIASQVDALRRYAKEQGYVIAEDYVCRDDGYSGASLVRPQLDRLRDGAEAGAFDAILVLTPDRLSRKYAYLILIMEEFERFGVDVIFVEHGLSDDPQSALLVQIQGAVAEYERAKHAERYRRGKLYRARQGEVFWTSIPYGYRRIRRQDNVPAHLVIDESEGEIVRKIFRWHATDDISIRQIARRLTLEGHVPPKGGKRWGETTVHRILRREAYLGILHYNRSQSITVPAEEGAGLCTKRIVRPQTEWIGVTIPALIERELFERSATRHEPNRQFSPRNLHEERWLLRRVLRCGKCGCKCACVVDKKRPQMPAEALAYYYRCNKQNRILDAERCMPSHYRAAPLDELVWTEIRRHLLNPSLLVKAEKLLSDNESLDQTFLSTQIRNTQRRLSQVRAERRRLIDAYQAGFIAKEEFEERERTVSRRTEGLQSDLRALQEEYKDVSVGKQLLTRIADFTTAVSRKIDELSFHQRQDIVRKVIKEVVIRDNIVNLYFKIPLSTPEKNPPGPISSPQKTAVSSDLNLRSRRRFRRLVSPRWHIYPDAAHPRCAVPQGLGTSCVQDADR